MRIHRVNEEGTVKGGDSVWKKVSLTFPCCERSRNKITELT